jgi:hypothetical protein
MFPLPSEPLILLPRCSLRRRAVAFLSVLIGLYSVVAAGQQPSHQKLIQNGLPILFEPAADMQQGMLAHVSGRSVWFHRTGIEIAPSGTAHDDLAIEFTGAHPAIPAGVDVQKSQTNYLLGTDPAGWRTHVVNFARVRYAELYPGIDAVFYGNGKRLEHDFVVHPGADYHQIRMRFPRSARIRIAKNGSLEVAYHGGHLDMEAPGIYQVESGRRTARNGAFRIITGREVGFTVSGYDPRYELVIDPTLNFSTYLSQYSQFVNSIAADSSGNSYVVGVGSLGYPVTTGAFSGCPECSAYNVLTFVSKLSADGSTLLYSTVLGGNNYTQPSGVVVDSKGDAIISGWTSATNFPTKSGQSVLPEGNNNVGFLTSLTPDGSALNYSTLLGPAPSATNSSNTIASAVAIDASDNAYVTGTTGIGFYISDGALNQGLSAPSGASAYTFNVYLAKFDPTGTLDYSAVLGTADPNNGGAGPIGPTAVAVDASGNAYVTGQAGVLWPTTSGAYHTQNPTQYAGPFVMKVAPDAKSVGYSTFLDYAYQVAGIALQADGSAMVVGNEADGNYPTTSDAYEANNGDGGPFLTILNPAGAALSYSTLLCQQACEPSGMALDPAGDIWLASSASSALPLVKPLQSSFSFTQSGPVNLVSALIEMDPTGKALKFSTFLGGQTSGAALAVATDAAGRVHVAGQAGNGMYTTAGAYAGSMPPPPANTELVYGYVALVDPAQQSAGLCFSSNVGPFFPTTMLGTHNDSTVTISSCGDLPLTITAVSSNAGDFTAPAGQNNCLQTLDVGQSCTLDVRFAPTTVGSQTATLSITSNAPIPAAITLMGIGYAAPIMTLSSTQLTFGPQMVGTQSAAQTVTITNSGNAVLNGIGFSTSATYESIFPLTYTCGPTLAAGASCSFSVSFVPATTGTATTTLLVENSSGLPNQQVTLTGSSPQIPFSIGAAQSGGTSSTVTAGSPATYSLAVTPEGGYSGTVNLTCSGLPTYASCSFNPAMLSLSSGANANFTLTIATETTQAAMLWRTGAGAVLAGLLLCLPLRRGRRLLLAALVLVIALAGATACGGSGGSSGGGPTGPQQSKVAPGTYTVTVTAATGGGTQATLPLTLVVQ